MYHKTFLATLCLSQWFLKTYTFAVSAILTLRRWRLWGKSTNKSVIFNYFYVALLFLYHLLLCWQYVWSLGDMSASDTARAQRQSECCNLVRKLLSFLGNFEVSYQVWNVSFSLPEPFSGRSPRGASPQLWQSGYEWAKYTRKLKKSTPNLPKMNRSTCGQAPRALQRGLLFGRRATNNTKHEARREMMLMLKMIDGDVVVVPLIYYSYYYAILTPSHHHLRVLFVVSSRRIGAGNGAYQLCNWNFIGNLFPKIMK